jgi:hypothetical protein
MGMTDDFGRLRERVREIGYTGERRALALLPLTLFGMLYLVLAANAEPGWGPALLGLSLCYLVAFFALASGWFWARWFASGLGWSGFMVGVMALVLFGWHPTLGIYAGLHGLVVAALLGPKMAALYELRPQWRERFSMDEFGVARLGKAVTRGASALPTLILWALAPREESFSAFGMTAPLETALLTLSLAFLFLGLVGLVRLRGFAILGLGAAAAVALVSAGLAAPGALIGMTAPFSGALPYSWTSFFAPAPALAVIFLVGAFTPLIRPLWLHLRGR